MYPPISMNYLSFPRLAWLPRTRLLAGLLPTALLSGESEGGEAQLSSLSPRAGQTQGVDNWTLASPQGLHRKYI